MRSCAAVIKAGERSPIRCVAHHRAIAPQLAQCVRAVEDVAARQAEAPFEIGGREYLPGNDRTAEVGCVLIHRGECGVGGFFAALRPVPLVREVLAKKACHVLSGRRQSVIRGRWNHEFNDRLP